MSTRGPTLESALAEHEAGRLPQAEAMYRQLLAESPSDLSVLIGLGDVLVDSGQEAAAQDCYRRAIELDGDSPAATGAYDGLAAVLQGIGDLDNAVAAGKKAAQLRGDGQETFEIAQTLEKLGRTQDALDMFLLATLQKPDLGHAHAKAAEHLSAQRRFAEAIPHYHSAITANPDVAENFCNLAIAQRSITDFAGALISSQRACELKPGLPAAWNIQGAICNDLGRTEAALIAFQRAIDLDPNYADAINNMGSTLHQAGRVQDAAPLFARAVKLEPYSIQFHQNLGNNCLIRGEFETGWKQFEWRRYKPTNPGSRAFLQPAWDGSSLAGKRIMLFAEQGFGDTIQFIRYVPTVAAFGGQVIVECQPALMSLVRRVAGVSEVISQHMPWPTCEVQSALLSLPMLFGTELDSIADAVPYINADPVKAEAWVPRLKELREKRIGLAWAGSPTHENDLKRSLPSAVLTPLGDVPGVSYISLQKQQRDIPPKELNLVDFTRELFDFDDTAALISRLDLVITADTAVAHLAGALGKPVWILLPFCPDWRWMTEREDSPWYPTARLFRQAVPGDWAGVIRQVCNALQG
jgi:tetratricopeptide (TPR) repeat protein